MTDSSHSHAVDLAERNRHEHARVCKATDAGCPKKLRRSRARRRVDDEADASIRASRGLQEGPAAQPLPRRIRFARESPLAFARPRRSGAVHQRLPGEREARQGGQPASRRSVRRSGKARITRGREGVDRSLHQRRFRREISRESRRASPSRSCPRRRQGRGRPLCSWPSAPRSHQHHSEIRLERKGTS
jgi:hypothetical protein